MHGAGLLQLVGDKVESYPIRRRHQLRIDCCRTATSMRIDCSGTAMEVSGSEPWSGGSSMSITAARMYLRKQMASPAMSSCSLFEDREGNVWVATLEDSTGFENSPSLLFL